MVKYGYVYTAGMKICYFIAQHYPNDNFLVSPTNIFIVLLFLYYGSSGETKKQLISFFKTTEASVLEMDDMLIKIFIRLCGLNKKKINPDETSNYLKISNVLCLREIHKKAYSLFISKKLVSSNDFIHLNKIKKNINSINTWLTSFTENSDENVHKLGQVSVDRSILIVSSVSFRSDWLDGFDQSKTSLRTFNVSEDIEKVVPMMKCVRKYMFYTNKGGMFTVLKVPYKWSDFFAYIILPYYSNNVNKCLEQLMKRDILSKKKFYSGIFYNTVKFKIPKLSMKFSASLKNILIDCGLKKLFKNECDLSSMSNETMHVSDIIQSNSFELYEQGGDGLPENAMYWRKYKQYKKNGVHEFTVDKPFIIMLIKSCPRVPLFVSIVRDPTAE